MSGQGPPVLPSDVLRFTPGSSDKPKPVSVSDTSRGTGRPKLSKSGVAHSRNGRKKRDQQQSQSTRPKLVNKHNHNQQPNPIPDSGSMDGNLEVVVCPSDSDSSSESHSGGSELGDGRPHVQGRVWENIPDSVSAGRGKARACKKASGSATRSTAGTTKVSSRVQRKAGNVTGGQALLAALKDAEDKAAGNKLAASDAIKEAEEVAEENSTLKKENTKMKEQLSSIVSQQDQLLLNRAKSLNVKWHEGHTINWVGPLLQLAMFILLAVLFGRFWGFAFLPSIFVPLWLDYFLVVYLGCTSWFFAGRRHHYKFVKFVDHGVKSDMRADSISLQDLKYGNPLYLQVKHVVREGWWVQRATFLTISFELLAQISTAENHSLISDHETVFQRIFHTAKKINRVNIDRYMSVCGESVVQDSCLVSYAIYRQMLLRVKHVPFPGPQPKL